MTGPAGTGQVRWAALSGTARLMLALLVVDAALLAVLELLYLPLRLPPRHGGAMLPLSVLLAAVSTPLLVSAAGRLAPRMAVAAAPLGAWVLTALAFGVAGPGGDVLLPADFRSLLLLVAGVLPSGVVLGRLPARPTMGLADRRLGDRRLGGRRLGDRGLEDSDGA